MGCGYKSSNRNVVSSTFNNGSNNGAQTYNRPFKKCYQSFKSKRGRTSGGAAMTYGNRMLAALYYPFSLKTNSPKWPDGLARYSLGFRSLFSGEVDRAEYLGIILFPGMNNHMVAFTCPHVAMSDELVDPDTSELRLAANASHRNLPSLITEKLGNNIHFRQKDDSAPPMAPLRQKFDSWRGVSYAAVITNINNHKENGGFFECVRTSRNAFSEFMGLTTEMYNGDTKGYKNYGVAECMPDPRFFEEFFRGEWADHPSYGYGKVTQLEKLIFQLNHEKRTNEFRDVKPLVVHKSAYYTLGDIGANDDYVPGGEDTVALFYVPADTTDNTANQYAGLKDSYISHSFDMIFIRIYGTPESRFHILSVANTEFTANNISSIQQLTTANYSAGTALEAYVENRNKYHKLPYHTLKQAWVNHENAYFY